MTTHTQTLSVDLAAIKRRSLEFLELTKPRVIPMVLVATFIGYYLGAGAEPAWWRLLHLLLSTALAAAGTLATNQYMERDVDALMDRTRLRPLPDGRIQPRAAFIFGAILIVTGLIYQVIAVNGLSAMVTAITIAGYLLVYTPLKVRTTWCSIPGAMAGALPPATGWAAASGSFGLEAGILVAIMFLWQMPHSLAIAWLYRDDYARAGIRLLPVIHPDGRSTALQILINSLALVAVGLLPTVIGLTGATYFISALLLGGAFFACCVGLAVSLSQSAAQRVVIASLLYLPIQFLLMAWDKLVL